MGSGNFDPNAPITREQMAVMLYNYMKYKGITIPTDTAAAFADESSISSWALEAIRAMGIVSGRPGNLFDPQATATGAEAATIFARFIEIEWLAGGAESANNTAASNTMNADTVLAMLPGKEDEIGDMADSGTRQKHEGKTVNYYRKTSRGSN